MKALLYIVGTTLLIQSFDFAKASNLNEDKWFEYFVFGVLFLGLGRVVDLLAKINNKIK